MKMPTMHLDSPAGKFLATFFPASNGGISAIIKPWSGGEIRVLFGPIENGCRVEKEVVTDIKIPFISQTLLSALITALVGIVTMAAPIVAPTSTAMVVATSPISKVVRAP